MNKVIKRIIILFVLVISIQVFLPKLATELHLINDTQAATIKLNKTKKTLYEGNTYKLKVKGTKKKVKWSSSDKSIAKVSSKGKVTAKKNGSAIITAKVGKKTLKCKVKVRLLQFKNDVFYSLKGASKIYNTKEIEELKTFSIDLDGDEVEDNITVEPYVYKNEYDTEYVEYIYKLNDNEFLRAETCELYFTDLDKNDKNIEFIIPSPYPYDCDFETRYAIYDKNGDSMKFVKDIDISRGMRVNKKGTILVNTYMQTGKYITPIIYRYCYQYKDKKISKKNLSVNSIKNHKFKINSTKYVPWYITNSKKNYKKGQKLLYDYAPNKKLLKYNIKKLRKGAKFKIIKYLDNKGEFYVKLLNGRKGYILNPYEYEHE